MLVSKALENVAPDQQITVLLADDHPVFRKAVRNILEEQDDLVVVAEANNGTEAVRSAIQLVPNVVIMDISMPELNGLEATRQIKAKYPDIKVLVLTVHDDIEHILSILEAGAAGYLTKRSIDEEIISAVRSIAMGETVMPTQIFQQLLKHILRYPSKPLVLEGKDRLTSRELEVLKLAARGLSNKEVSQELNLSLSTVKAYMVEIFYKLNVGSRTEAVIKGLRIGLINANDIE